jgi:hypothetical protein
LGSYYNDVREKILCEVAKEVHRSSGEPNESYFGTQRVRGHRVSVKAIGNCLEDGSMSN